jgi:hypothetical protein
MTERSPKWDRLGIVALLRPRLPKPQYNWVWFVAERTIGFCKDDERIPMRHCIEGVMSRETGDVITQRTGYSRPSVYRAMKQVLAMGIVEVTGTDDDGVKRYRINLEKCQDIINGVRHPPSQDETPPVSKRDTPRLILRRGRAHCNTRGGNDNIKGSKQMKIRIPATSAGSRVANIINSTVAKTAATKNKKLAAGKFEALVRYWADQHREHFPDRNFAGWSKVDGFRFKAILHRLGEVDPRDFIRVIFSEWTAITRTRFRTLDNKPSTPTLMFVGSFLDALLGEYDKIKTGGSPSDKAMDAKDQEIRKLNRLVNEANERARRNEVRAETAEATLFVREHAGTSPRRSPVEIVSRALEERKRKDEDTRVARLRNAVKILPKQIRDFELKDFDE